MKTPAYVKDKLQVTGFELVQLYILRRLQLLLLYSAINNFLNGYYSLIITITSIVDILVYARVADIKMSF